MVLKKSELTLPSKMQNTPFRQGKTFLTRGIVIIGCIRNVIWLSVFSIKSKLFAELLLVMISLLHRFLLSYTLLPFGFCLNDTTLLSFQIRSSIILTKNQNNTKRLPCLSHGSRSCLFSRCIIELNGIFVDKCGKDGSYYLGYPECVPYAVRPCQSAEDKRQRQDYHNIPEQ